MNVIFNEEFFTMRDNVRLYTLIAMRLRISNCR